MSKVIKRTFVHYKFRIAVDRLRIVTSSSARERKHFLAHDSRMKIFCFHLRFENCFHLTKFPLARVFHSIWLLSDNLWVMENIFHENLWKKRFSQDLIIPLANSEKLFFSQFSCLLSLLWFEDVFIVKTAFICFFKMKQPFVSCLHEKWKFYENKQCGKIEWHSKCVATADQSKIKRKLDWNRWKFDFLGSKWMCSSSSELCYELKINSTAKNGRIFTNLDSHLVHLHWVS